MQSISTLTAADLLAKAQTPLRKFEIYVGSSWVDLGDFGGESYIKSLSVVPSGAGPTPAVVAGTWTAEIANPDGIFHSLNASSGYGQFFTVGRKARISFGGVFGTEKLTDGGLETWASSTNLTNWTEDIYGTSVVEREASVVYEGTYAARISQDTSGSHAGIYQTGIAIESGKTCRFSGRYRTSEGHKARLYVYCGPAWNASLQGTLQEPEWGDPWQYIELPEAMDDWAPFSVTFPSHSAYTNYLVSVSANDGDSRSVVYFDDLSLTVLDDYYWQRIIGYMDAPRFNHKTHTVSLSGCDYSKRLADFILKSPDNYWGSSATFSTVATSSSLGSEIYAEADVLDSASEANNITNWTDDANSTAAAATDAALGSTYLMTITKDADSAGYVSNTNVGSVTAGNEYECSFDYLRSVGDTGSITALIYETDGSPIMGYSEPGESETATSLTFRFTATSSTTMMLKFKVSGDSGTVFKVDNVTIKPVTTPGLNYLYTLPDASNGAYYATLNGAPIYADDPAEKLGWTNTDGSPIFRFVDGAVVAAGTNNLVVYYYTSQAPEDVVADILADVGLYADKATALAAMSYTATGITIPRVWFDAGTTAQRAIEMICERVNYRFWFDYAGVPQFKAAPEAGTADLSLTSWGHLVSLEDHEDREQIRNHVTIEGIEKSESEASETKKKTRLVGSSSDATSIAAYGEHTESIRNHLFQDQAAIDAMCAAVLADRKDPALFASVDLGHCAAPLEVGDTVEWDTVLSSTLSVSVSGVVTALAIQNGIQTATVKLDLEAMSYSLTADAGAYVVTGSDATLTHISGDTYWVSPTGTATWSNAKSETPLSGTACASLATALANAEAGDTVYLRDGAYTKTLAPANSGTSGSPITFAAYTAETPTFTVTTDFRWAIQLQSRSYIVIDGIKSSGSGAFFVICYGSHYNEIKNCEFELSSAIYQVGSIQSANTAFTAFSGCTHNWIHDNKFSKYGKVTGCSDSGTIRIGGYYYDDCHHNTFEDNEFEYGGHDLIDIGCSYNVVRNNTFHNEEAYFADPGGCPNSPITSGYFGNRNVLLSNYGDHPGTALHTLIEGNRIGHSGMPPDETVGAGCHGIENAGCHSLIRYNYIYASAGTGIYLKSQPVVYYESGVTGDAATDTLTYVGHAFSNGDPVYLYGLSGGEGLLAGDYYYIVNADADTFQLSETLGGSAVNFTTDITDTYVVQRYLKSGSWTRACHNTIFHSGFGDASIDASRYGVRDVGMSATWYPYNWPWPVDFKFRNNINYDWNTDEYFFSASAAGEYEYTGNYNSNPVFVDADISDPTSLTLPDLRLSASSPCLEAGTYLTLANGSGSSSVTLVVDDARWFQDGTWGSSLSDIKPDEIAIGTVGNTVAISSVDYATNTITLASAKSWDDDDPVWLYKNSSGTTVLTGSAPNYGAYSGAGESTGDYTIAAASGSYAVTGTDVTLTHTGGSVSYFGQNSDGSGHGYRGGNYLRLERFENTVGTGNITELGINFNTGNTGEVRLGVYADDAGDPGALIADAGEIDNPVAGWNTISGLSIAVTGGAYYWLAWVSNVSCDVYHDTTYPFYYEAYTYGTLPSSTGTVTPQYNRTSMRAGVTTS